MEAARSFRQLVVWQKAHQLVLAVYHLTADFPRSEVFGLTSQLRRAVVSVPANIAEGFRRISNPEKVRFLNIAQGSLEECRYYLILANDLAYAETTIQQEDLDEVGRLLDGYIKSIQKNHERSSAVS